MEDITVEERVNCEYPRYLPTYDGCYVCGQAHPRGLRTRFFVGDDEQVHAWFCPDETQTGYEGVVHGGVIGALLDEILGWPIALKTGRLSFTGELTIRFVKPISPGHTYLATAYPGTHRGRYWEARGDIRDKSDEICAKAQGKYFLLSPEQTVAVAERLTFQSDDLPVFQHKRLIESTFEDHTEGIDYEKEKCRNTAI
jgi:uncharacterized protein (TIGR00369 family)